jgi:hypothetical protein
MQSFKIEFFVSVALYIHSSMVLFVLHHMEEGETFMSSAIVSAFIDVELFHILHRLIEIHWFDC